MDALPDVFELSPSRSVTVGRDSAAISVVDLLRQRAERSPARPAFRFVEGTRQTNQLDYGTLYARASSWAASLQRLSLAGERVLLVTKTQQSFVIGLFGCLLAGAVAAPAPVPRRQHLQHRLHLVAQDCGARAIMTDSEDVLKLDFGTRGWSCLDLRSTPDDPPGPWVPARPRADSLAFLQYTSGSTGEPKGVMVTHGSIMANLQAIRGFQCLDEHARKLVALPLFHDMGLIDGVLMPVHAGCVGYLMSPQLMVASPALWLHVISRERITVSGGPNFMYELAVEAKDDLLAQDIDLSHWRVAYCGAEPIKPATMRRFHKTFGAQGFRAESFVPCYGMAEATLFISAHLIDTAPLTCEVLRQGRRSEIVSCGRPQPLHRVIVVDPLTCRPCAEGAEGEIWFSGPSVAAGYWNKPAITAQVFNGRLPDPAEGPFLRTGDLGFMQNENLYVSGRLKDLIIVRGRKFVPQDLEQVAERSHSSIRPSCIAAFMTVDDEGHEQVIVAAELERTALRKPDDWPGVRAAIQRAILKDFELKVDEVVLLRPGGVPKTSSGKLQRSACAAGYRSGQLERVDLAPATPPLGSIEWLQCELAVVLKRSPGELLPNVDFADLGLDSMNVLQFSLRISQALQTEIEPGTVYDCGSLATVHEWIARNASPSQAAQVQ